MIKLKTLLNNNKLTILYFLSILIVSLIMSFLGLFNVKYSLVSMLSVIINIILVFIYSYINGRKKSDKGYKIGIKSWVIIVFILIVLNILNASFKSFHFKTIVYYVLLLIISISGGIIGKNKQKKLS